MPLTKAGGCGYEYLCASVRYNLFVLNYSFPNHVAINYFAPNYFAINHLAPNHFPPNYFTLPTLPALTY